MLETLPDFGAMLPAAYENLKSLLWTDSPLDMAIRIVWAYLVAVWLASVIWTVRDITDRTGNVLIQTFSVLLVVLFTPILGLPLYLLIRPRTTLAERYYEEAGLAESEYVSACPNCETEVGEEFRFCPNCGTGLLEVCPNCGASKEKEWKFCSHCGSDGKRSEKKPVQTPEKKEHSKKSETSWTKNKKDEGAETPENSVGTEAPEAADTVEAVPEAVKKPTVTVVSMGDIPEAGR